MSRRSQHLRSSVDSADVRNGLRLGALSAQAGGATGCADFRQARSLSRRDVLRAGGAGLLSLSLPQLLAAQDASRLTAPPDALSALQSTGFGRAKRCIFFFMWGGPSQLDTFDLKPAAPAEVRGEFQPIATRVPGLQICEHFQKLAPHADKLALVRSLSHRDPAHLSSGHAILTGHLAPIINSDAAPPSQRDTPHIGSLLSYVRGGHGQLPAAVTMPWHAYHPAAPGGVAPGQHGGWLGRKFDPMLLTGDPSQPGWQIPELTLGDGVSLERLESRRAMLGAVDLQRGMLDSAAEAIDLQGYQQQAMGLLTSPAARAAFDLQQESPETRDRYGRNLHGQCALLARRLIERGVPLVSVNWHNDGKNFWDTHGNNFKRLKNDLIPPADQALAALLADLTDRGLLDDTIVAWVGEFGRKPQIDARHAGREHWPFCYTGLLAGGGIRGGAIYGSSDKLAMRPATKPVRPQDFTATLYHALGVRTDLTVDDRSGRPQKFTEGVPIYDLFG